MTSLSVRGGRSLTGCLPVQGAKNSALPLLAAALLTSETCVLHNCPCLTDTEVSCRILTHLGCFVTRDGDTVTVRGADTLRADIPVSLMRRMRSSIVFLGALLGRAHKANVCPPGGCELGKRPIDLHLAALTRLGVTVSEESGCLTCTCARLTGETVDLTFPSVGATENILLASVLASGTTVIRNAAREPEIVDLACFLNRMGARVRGAGESVVRVDGVGKLHGCEYTVMPDRIAAATFLTAAAVTKGDVLLTNACHLHLTPVLTALSDMGCRIRTDGTRIRLTAPARLASPHNITTAPYPGFPTDAQAILMAAAAVAKGSCTFTETLFESRFKHVPELIRMGASITVDGRTATVRGVDRLRSATVSCTDLRGGAALLIASLAAEGESVLTDIAHLDRGYERIEQSFRSLGGDVRRVND